eukprot:1159705-Pelagomonas_calceolata.AAC.16
MHCPAFDALPPSVVVFLEGERTENKEDCCLVANPEEVCTLEEGYEAFFPFNIARWGGLVSSLGSFKPQVACWIASIMFACKRAV